MDMYPQYKSPLGYTNGDNKIDAYGVDHSGFSTRDELEYQFARQNKENQLIQNYNNQGITKNYPQQGTNFWGNSDNNYGFGSSNIHDNIENKNNNLFENTMNTFGQSQTEQSYGLGNNNQNQCSSSSYNSPNCYMRFDGKNLNLFANNQKVNSLDAMSGQPDYQAKKFQNVSNRGPIPEGAYYANQNQRQKIGVLDAAIGAATGVLGINRGTWKGSLPAWGMRRIWLKPDSDTNTYGRDGFTIHGGFSKGSAGCIDIPWQTGILSDYMDNCQESVPVYVGYHKDNW